ncbi:MAG: hypothetical protein ACYDEN_04725 [Acidimicrobiales bacterium]
MGGTARVRSPAVERFTGPRYSDESGRRFIDPVTDRVGGSPPRSRSLQSKPVSSPGRRRTRRPVTTRAWSRSPAAASRRLRASTAVKDRRRGAGSQRGMIDWRAALRATSCRRSAWDKASPRMVLMRPT